MVANSSRFERSEKFAVTANPVRHLRRDAGE